MKEGKSRRRNGVAASNGTAAAQKRPPQHPLPVSPGARTSPRDLELFVKHYHRDESAENLGERKRLFLRVGDEVNHLRYEEWGIGVVQEVMTSSVPGGTCLARVRFQDGQLRCFNNDLDNEACCYYFGLRRYWNPSRGFNAVRSKFFLRG